MYPPSSSRTRFLPPSSRRSSASGEPPLTAERAMIDQIRSKLERAQRRLNRNAPSSVASRYIPSSEYTSATHKPPVKSVLVEDMPATASKHYSSSVAPPSTMRPPPSTMRPPPSSRKLPPPSSRRPPPSKYEASRYQQQQYKSRSKYNQNSLEADPLNGGPPPMSTPYLVYSSSRPPVTSSHLKSNRPPVSKAREKERETDRRDRMPTSSMLGPPSAMRSGYPKPPTSRVRFEGHDAERRESLNLKERESEADRKRRHQQMKEREARHLRHRQKELESVNARAKGSGPSSPIAAATRGRRSLSVEKPPGSAIDAAAYQEMDPRRRRSSSVEKPTGSATKPSAYDENPRGPSVEKPPPSAIDLSAFKESPAGRPRRSSMNFPPPKSDIDVAAINEVIPRRRSSAAQDNQPKVAEPAQPEETVNVPAVEEHTQLEEAVENLKLDSGAADSDQRHSLEDEHRKIVQAFPSPPPSALPEPIDSDSSDKDGDTSGFESDSSDFSDFDVDSDYELSSGYSGCSGFTSTAQSEVIKEDEEEDNQDDAEPSEGNQAPESEDGPQSPPASELFLVEEEPQPRLTARDLAFLALGRASSCSLSDVGSPVASANATNSPKKTPAPMSYVPASSAFPHSRLARPPMPATTGRAKGTGILPPAPQTSSANYIRRSRARAPMDLKNQLPPSIGVLSGLSSGSLTFAVDPSNFYEVIWKSGEFAFSVQRVYTDENEFEFDDRNQEPQLFLRMLLNTERSTCRGFRDVRVGDILIRVGDAYVSELGLEGGSGTVLTKFFAKLTAQTPIKLTFQRMSFNEWEGGVEL